MRRIFRSLFAFLFFCTAASAADEVVRTCAACSWEVSLQARFCSHCGAAQDGSAQPAATAAAQAAVNTPSAENASAAGAADKATLSKKAASMDAALYAKISDKSPAVRLAAVRNSLSASILEESPSASQLKALSERESRLVTQLAFVFAACPNCHGAGKIKAANGPKLQLKNSRSGEIKRLEEVSVKQLNEGGSAGFQRCLFCNGAGRAKQVRDREELLGLERLGAREYERLAHAERKNVQGVWLPGEAEELLSLEEQAKLAHNVFLNRVCEGCAGTGSLPCKGCDGFGKTLCSNKDFHNPRANRTANAAARNSEIRTIEEQLLENTGASAAKRCPLCHSSPNFIGAMRCQACDGKAISICNECNGSTYKAVCKKCSGRGIEACRFCARKNKKNKDEACTECEAVGQVFCKTCGGTGYGR